MSTSPLRVGIIGDGHLGKFLKTELAKLSTDFQVVKVWNRSAREEEQVLPLDCITEEHLREVDLVVEVAHPALVKQYAQIILQHSDFFILVPSGAFWGGNDIQKMADLGTLKGLKVTMRKNPSSFKLESPLKEINEDAKKQLQTPTILYEGPVRGICSLAPNNVNTMAGAALAAHNLGFDGVKAVLISDPQEVAFHIVEILVTGSDGFQVETIRRNPCKAGVVTGELTYFSFLASIKESRFKPSGVISIC